MDESSARRAVEVALGKTPLRLIPQPFGHHSVTFEAVLPGRSVMVRMNADPAEFAATSRNIATLRELEVPVPTVLFEDLSCTSLPFAFLILEKIPGRDLRYELAAMTFAQRDTLARQIVAIQRNVAELPYGHGFGWVPIGADGPYDSWLELVGADLARSASSVPSSLYQLVVRALDAHRETLATILPTCFLDDITIKNVIIESGQLRGVVDFDVVCYGDPLYTIALTATGIVSDVGTDHLDYVERLLHHWHATPADRARTGLYAAIFGLEFLSRMSATESPAWRTRMQTQVAQWAAEAAIQAAPGSDR